MYPLNTVLAANNFFERVMHRKGQSCFGYTCDIDFCVYLSELHPYVTDGEIRLLLQGYKRRMDTLAYIEEE